MHNRADNIRKCHDTHLKKVNSMSVIRNKAHIFQLKDANQYGRPPLLFISSICVISEVMVWVKFHQTLSATERDISIFIAALDCGIAYYQRELPSHLTEIGNIFNIKARR